VSASISPYIKFNCIAISSRWYGPTIYRISFTDQGRWTYIWNGSKRL